jgi:hypothetical protein
MTKNDVIAHVIVVGPLDSLLWEFMQYSMYGNASIVPLASNHSIAGWFIHCVMGRKGLRSRGDP